MPQIRIQDAGELGIKPTELGVDSFAAAGRRVGMFYNQVADSKNQLGSEVGSAIRDGGQVAVDYEDHREISAGAANGAQFVANFNDAWNKTIKTADPNDPTVKQKFLEQNLEPALDQFKSGFNTEKSQEWAEHFADQYRQHMFEKTAADMSTKAGEAVRVNAEKTINGLATAAYSDPSSLEFALKSVDHSIGGIVDSSPTLTPDTAASIKGEVSLHAKESIVLAAGRGMVTQNPSADLSAFEKKYGEYLKPGEIQTLQKAAQVQAKSNALIDKQTQVQQRQLDELNVHQSANKVLTDNVTFDQQTGRPIIDPKYFSQALDIIKKNPNAPNAASTVQTMFNWGESQQSKSDHMTDPATASALDNRMWVPENPTSKLDIMKAEADKKISRSDAQIRMNLIDQRDKMPTDPQFKFAMDGAKQMIDGRTAGEKSMQAGKYPAFMQEFLGEYQRQKNAGTLPADALSLRNPNSLISKTMEAYKSPLAAAVSGNGGITPPPSPPAAAAAPEPIGPKPGDIRPGTNGSFKFKGGDPRKKENWEPVS